jgi:surface antigen
MAGKKKTNRGAHLKGVGCPANSRKRSADQLDGAGSARDPDFVPEDHEEDDDKPECETTADVEPEEREPGSKRSAHRAAVLENEGPAGLQRLDAQKERQRRCRGAQARASQGAVQCFIEDALDGTLQAKKLAQELEPDDAWAAAEVAVAEAVATNADGQRIVVLGEAVAAADHGASSSAVEEVRPRIGRPPGSSTKSPGSRYASHRSLAPGSVGNPTTSKAERSAVRKAAAALRECGAEGVPGEPPAKRRADADMERGPQLLPKLRYELSHLGDRLLAIASVRRFERTDFVDGELISPGDWMDLRESSWELRRVYAMAHFVALQRHGTGVVAGCEQVAEAVRLGKEAHGMTSRTVHTWLTDYIKSGGKITPSRTGCHAKTESFLSDESIKEAALDWLRHNVRAAQPKGSTESPLNVPRYGVPIAVCAHAAA